MLTTPKWFTPFSLSASVVFLLLLAIAGCGGDDEVTGPGDSGAILTDAYAKVNGQSINGQTIHIGQNVDGTVRFEGCLLDSRGNSVSNHNV